MEGGKKGWSFNPSREAASRKPTSTEEGGIPVVYL